MAALAAEDERIVPPVPPDPYTLRDLEEQRDVAVDQWTRLVSRSCQLELLAALLMLYSRFWFLSTLGVVAAAVGYFGARRSDYRLALAYMVLIVAACLKNVALLVLYAEDGASRYDFVVILVAVADLIVVEPYSLYNAFYYYQSIRTNLTFDDPGYQ